MSALGRTAACVVTSIKRMNESILTTRVEDVPNVANSWFLGLSEASLVNALIRDVLPALVYPTTAMVGISIAKRRFLINFRCCSSLTISARRFRSRSFERKAILSVDHPVRSYFK